MAAAACVHTLRAWCGQRRRTRVDDPAASMRKAFGKISLTVK
ncbi:hypothetical protein I552_9106 [Mycobacterium xenopi 3993]|nr:hypothetical protein I552_9106 [Mycobacterium xenopi 3993]